MFPYLSQFFLFRSYKEATVRKRAAVPGGPSSGKIVANQLSIVLVYKHIY